MMTRQEILQIRIALVGINPPVWRRIQIPSTYSFWDLHVAIQDAMGWTDTHLHEFQVPDPRSGAVLNVGVPADETEDSAPTVPGWDLPVREYLHQRSPVVTYEYDFGDLWVHVIQLEAELPAEASRQYPVCLGGERNRPPEDCGGAAGYERFLEVIAEPSDPEHESMLEWVGGSFDPEEFDPANVCFNDPREHWDLVFGDSDTVQ
jgi:hypothetical protein